MELKFYSKEFNEIIKLEEVPTFPTFVGEWYFGKEYSEVKSPIDLSVIAKVTKLEYEIAEKTIERMYKKKECLTIKERLELLKNLLNSFEKVKEDLINVLVINAGKPKDIAKGEVEGCIKRLKVVEYEIKNFDGKHIDGSWNNEKIEGIVKREPVGIVLVISPFNYPLFNVVDKFVSSFLFGNSVIIKPSSLVPIPTILFARLLEISNFPKNSFSIFTIPGKEMNKIVSDKRISTIIFTGSSEVGEEIVRNAGMKNYILECGGGAICFVLKDADLEKASEKIVKGITLYSGQRCDAIKIVFAEKEVYEILKEKIVEKISRLEVGDPREKNLGPIVDLSAIDEYEKALEDAKKKSAKILYGKRVGKNYVLPTIIEADKNIVKDLYAFNKEIFLSLAILVRVESFEEAIEISNQRNYGLDACIFGRDLNKIKEICDKINVGAIYINDFPRHGIGYFPYGGRKNSGIGFWGIGYSVERLTNYKSIIFNFE
jgi:glyceraldehyde-3-phosphate dehydrogenase [NAD(P)+]